MLLNYDFYKQISSSFTYGLTSMFYWLDTLAFHGCNKNAQTESGSHSLLNSVLKYFEMLTFLKDEVGPKSLLVKDWLE